MDTPTNSAQRAGPQRAAIAALSIGALSLSALIAATAAGLFDRSAKAEMTVKNGAYSALTTTVTTRELMFLIDDRTETLLVYDNTSSGTIELAYQLSLPQTFTSARVSAGGGRRRP